MASIYDGHPQKSIDKIAQALKPFIGIPEWTIYVKTGPGKERIPDDKEWYLKRTAAVLRTAYTKGPIGVNKLRTKFGNKKNRGHRPGKFARASGKIIRTILQQLEKQGFVEQKTVHGHKGRIITPKGRSLIDKNTVREK